MNDKYWALADIHYPDGDAEYAKAVRGQVYREVFVKAGEPLVNLPEKSLKALLSMGRDVITTSPPKPTSAPMTKKVVKP